MFYLEGDNCLCPAQLLLLVHTNKIPFLERILKFYLVYLNCYLHVFQSSIMIVTFLLYYKGEINCALMPSSKPAFTKKPQKNGHVCSCAFVHFQVFGSWQGPE